MSEQIPRCPQTRFAKVWNPEIPDLELRAAHIHSLFGGLDSRTRKCLCPKNNDVPKVSPSWSLYMLLELVCSNLFWRFLDLACRPCRPVDFHSGRSNWRTSEITISAKDFRQGKTLLLAACAAAGSLSQHLKGTFY